MQENYTSSLITMFIEMLLALLFLGLVFFGFQLQQINSYKQQVNYTIERQGGLTAAAITDLKKLSNENYSGYFTIVATTTDKNADGVVAVGEGLVKSADGKSWLPASTQGDFGQQYKYKMHIKIPIPFGGVLAAKEDSALKYFETDMIGSSVSKVRR